MRRVCPKCSGRPDATCPSLDDNSNQHQCRIHHIKSFKVLKKDKFEKRIWPSSKEPAVLACNAIMPYVSESKNPKKTFLTLLRRRGIVGGAASAPTT